MGRKDLSAEGPAQFPVSVQVQLHFGNASSAFQSFCPRISLEGHKASEGGFDTDLGSDSIADMVSAEGECRGGVPSAACWNPGHPAGLLPVPSCRFCTALSLEAALAVFQQSQNSFASKC